MFFKKQDKIILGRVIQSNIDGRSLWEDAFIRFRKNRAAMFSIFVLFFILLFIFFVPFFSSFSFDESNWDHILQVPGFSTGHYFGTDILGRDLFVRLAVGGQISLLVGFLGALFSVMIGMIYGAISGYWGGMLDRMMMRFLDILNAFPFMFFIILLVSLFGRNIAFIFIAIGLFSWINIARIVRGQTLSLKNKEFIDAAIVSGASHFQIIMKHVIPNVLGIVVIYASMMVPTMILLESFLSFLGLGVQEPMTSWGGLLQEGVQNMQISLWQLVFPTVFLVVTLFCFNFIGDGLRDALDPQNL